MTLTQVKKAVRGLTDEERKLFRQWFLELEADLWDREIEEDARSGRLDFLAEEALAEYRAGT